MCRILGHVWRGSEARSEPGKRPFAKPLQFAKTMRPTPSAMMSLRLVPLLFLLAFMSFVADAAEPAGWAGADV